MSRRTCNACGKTERLFDGEEWPVADAIPHRGYTATGIEASLRAAIAASPDDDAPRSVYADWLIEQGDPLGTFIASQLERVRRHKGLPSSIEQDLANTYWRSWLGEIGNALAPAQVTFERGMWSACDLLYRTIAPDFVADPAWCTVRRLQIGMGRPVLRALLEGPVRRSLREVWVANNTDELEIVLDADLPLARIDFAMAMKPFDLRRAAKLEAIGLHCWGKDAPAFLDAADAAGIDNLTLTLEDVGTRHVELLVAHAQRARCSKLAIAIPGFVYHLERRGELVIRRLDLVPEKVKNASLLDALYRLRPFMPYIDPALEVTMRRIPEGFAEQAAQLGLNLVRFATSFGMSPRPPPRDGASISS